MTEDKQNIPVDGVTRLTLESRDSSVILRWDESLTELQVSGGHLEVSRADDELYARVAHSRGESEEGESPEIRISGFESPGQAVEEILFRTGILSGRSRGRKGEPVTIDIPASLRKSNIEVDSGDLRLQNPQGESVCKMKRGNFVSSGGRAELDISTGSGQIQVTGLSGALRAAGGSGDISVTDADATTNIKAGSGEVSLSRVHGDAIKLAAGSGDVSVKDCTANAYSSECGSGDVMIDRGSLERINVRTGSGDVDCTAVFGPYSQSFTTGSGSISLGVPRQVSARIEAFTSGGDIDTDLPLVSVGQRGPKSRRSRRQVGSVGEGEPRAEVSLRTSSGDIRIRWLSQAASQAIPMPPPVPDVPQPPEPPRPPGAPVPPIPPVPPESPDEVDTTSKKDAGGKDEWQEILESLANGEISVEEADALLGSLESRRTDAGR
jgi:DUF4097 and DUF4098 domain-containing protein YvlB